MPRTACLLALALALLTSGVQGARLLQAQAQAASSATASGQGASWASASASSTDSESSIHPLDTLLGHMMPAQPEPAAFQPTFGASAGQMPLLAVPATPAGFPSDDFPALLSTTFPSATPIPSTATNTPAGGMPAGSSATPGTGAGAGSPAASSNGAGGCPDVQATLDAHNTARAAAGLAPLSWSDSLASYAAGVSATCRLVHSHGPYGENLFIGSNARTCKVAVDAWMSEAASRGGHYTQIVYPATTQVGCAIAPCGMVTCSYDVIQGSRGM